MLVLQLSWLLNAVVAKANVEKRAVDRDLECAADDIECGANFQAIEESGVTVCEKDLVVTSSRVIVIADVHGDWGQFRLAMQRAGLVRSDPIDGSSTRTNKHTWTGGDATLIQTGDILDRGPDSLYIFEVLIDLKAQARAAGGCFAQVLGNHELMNLANDMRYADPQETRQFGGMRARQVAMNKGHWLGDYLRDLPIAIRLVQTPFSHSRGKTTGKDSHPELSEDYGARNITTIACHAGISPLIAKQTSLEDMNSMIGDAFRAADMRAVERLAYTSKILLGQGPLWSRIYADPEEGRTCPTLSTALELLHADRMIVGHTVQATGRPTVRCGGRLIMADTGMSSYYGGGFSLVELEPNNGAIKLFDETF